MALFFLLSLLSTSKVQNKVFKFFLIFTSQIGKCWHLFFRALTQFKAPILQHQEDVLLLMAAPHCSLQLPESHSVEVCGTAVPFWFSLCMPIWTAASQQYHEPGSLQHSWQVLSYKNGFSGKFLVGASIQVMLKEGRLRVTQQEFFCVVLICLIQEWNTGFSLWQDGSNTHCWKLSEF